MTTTEEAHTLSNLTSLYQESANEQINLLLHYHENNENEAIASLLDTLVEGRFHQETNATTYSTRIRSPYTCMYEHVPRSLEGIYIYTHTNLE